jgi:type 2 lantibiotic biosynthesis protein LanM
METGLERVLARAATIDELLSSDYQQLPGQKGDADLAGRRAAAWCRASASGDWSLFGRRLQRDGLSIDDVLARFATVRRNPAIPAPGWMQDAEWVTAALCDPADCEPIDPQVAFERLLTPAVHAAQTRLWAGVDARLRATLTDGAHADLRRALLTDLSDLAAPAIFVRFADARERGMGYRDFVSDMRAAGFLCLFEDKPVLLRLMASMTRQWIDTTRELIARLAVDMSTIRREVIGSDTACRVSTIEGRLSDPHNFGRTVQILGFEDGSRVVYKPKDLGVDAAWRALVNRLNDSAPPMELRAMRVLVRENYGWTEFIEHASCDDPEDFRAFFRRAGAWLALFHVFVGVDMHQENIVATGSHPVPIDLEMILQSADTRMQSDDDSSAAFASAMQEIIDSVLTVGLLPAYGRHSTSEVFVIGGVHSNSMPRVTVRWSDVNTDAMQSLKMVDSAMTVTNVPFVDGLRARLGDHLDELMSGFGDYARFLRRQDPHVLIDDFAELVARRVIRPTRFYTGVLARLRDPRTMDDGAIWSAQADFGARLADWESDTDPMWPLQRDERLSLVDLNVPHFTTTTDLDRARARLGALTDDLIDWQIELIRQNTDLLRRQSSVRDLLPTPAVGRAEPMFAAEANALASKLSAYAVREGSGAAWIGLDWLGDTEVSQLVVLGPDLYNGACGVALFLAAHAAVTGDTSSQTLARSALAGLRHHLRGRNPARMARSLGIGAGLGVGSIVYGLAVIADLLDDDAILADACAAAQLITDDAIAADRQLDVLGGGAGAILGLLRLYRQTGAEHALSLAEKCGRQLLANDRVGMPGQRTWVTPAFGRPLNGMSHGAAGYAYSLQALATATRCAEFAGAAAECLAFEESTFDVDKRGWADLRDMAGAAFPCKWCYGAPGIGLARIAMTRLAGVPLASCVTDIDRAVDGVELGWPAPTDTVCCGTLGSIEFMWEAADAVGRDELRDRATQRLLTVVETARAAGEYRWSSGTGRFNLGFFRGIAGVGYTLLRAVEGSLPNVLIWE